MKLNLKMLAVSTALLGLLAAGAALPASAAGPLNAAAALSLPWSAAAVESVETGSYASTMTVGTQQQLSPAERYKRVHFEPEKLRGFLF